MADTPQAFTPEQQAALDSIAQRAIEGVFTRLGVDINDPLSAQKDFALLRAMRMDENLKADLDFAHRLRVAGEKVTDTSVRTVVRVLVTGALGLLLLGTKDWWIKHITG